jgi:ATP-dependent exoDNAse (exonuclease V) alpha subunit
MSQSENNLDWNDQFTLALDLMEKGNRNIFLTGKAGTGKSTLLQHFRDTTAKNVVVLAPTGVAALNVKGQTIHSFFKFRPDVTPDSVRSMNVYSSTRRVYERLDAIVIDEISMVRADMLDCIDAFLQIYGKYPDLPFGGVQMIFIGDLFQLPPVVPPQERDIFRQVYPSPYFFDAKAYQYLKPVVVELGKIYRQEEENYIRILNAIRNNSIGRDELIQLNQRYIQNFSPATDDFYIYLTTTNRIADLINEEHLQKLDSPPVQWEGIVSGAFDSKNFPTRDVLELKQGAQVMLLNNDSAGRWINGTIGRVTKVNDENQEVIVELADGDEVEVKPFKWDIYRYEFNEDTEQLEAQSVGSFTQIPLRLAWAVTIHKSQGMTFPKVVVDIGEGAFAHGQTYVALSRCSRFDGLVLTKPIEKRHIILDSRVVEFMSRIERSAAEPISS